MLHSWYFLSVKFFRWFYEYINRMFFFCCIANRSCFWTWTKRSFCGIEKPWPNGVSNGTRSSRIKRLIGGWKSHPISISLTEIKWKWTSWQNRPKKTWWSSSISFSITNLPRGESCPFRFFPSPPEGPETPTWKGGTPSRWRSKMDSNPLPL